jgi:hypothetical protein
VSSVFKFVGRGAIFLLPFAVLFGIRSRSSAAVLVFGLKGRDSLARGNALGGREVVFQAESLGQVELSHPFGVQDTYVRSQGVAPG